MTHEEKYHKYKYKYLELKKTLTNNTLQTGGNNKTTILLITRSLTKNIQNKLESLLQVGIDAYIICDDFPSHTSDRIIHFSDKEMEKIGWTHHMSQVHNQITAWDKGTYFAYKLNRPFVWICEDDVYWNNSNSMKQLLEINSNDDLIAYPLLEKYEDDQTWYHWEKAKLMTSDYSKWTATYNQLCRLSNRLLKKAYDLSQHRNRLFFHEVMFATLCNINNYSIGYFNKLNLSMFIYFRYENPFIEKQIEELEKLHKNILLHPVKFNIK